MDVPQLSPQLIDALRTWFHPKDRSVYLAPSTFAFLPGGIGYLSMAFISETILTASAASVTFSNIPQGFRHLVLMSQARTDSGGASDNVLLRFNNDSAANYDFNEMYGNAAAAAATTLRATASSITAIAETSTARGNNFAPGISWIMDYSTDKEARVLTLTSRLGDLSADNTLYVLARALHWRNRDVITSVVIVPQVGPNFVSGSRFQLYGIL